MWDSISKPNKYNKNNKMQSKTLETLKTELKGKCSSILDTTKDGHFKSTDINQNGKNKSERPTTKYLSLISVKVLEKSRTNGDEKIALNLPSLAKGISPQKERKISINQDKLSQLGSHSSGPETEGLL